MNEKQAKRLRRAVRLYVAVETPKLTKGDNAATKALRLRRLIASAWHRIVSHRARGRIGTLLRSGNLYSAAAQIGRAS